MLHICKTYYPDELRRLMTIPGIKERAATSLIAEIGVDMTKFQTAAHLASWSGLKPRNDESNGKYKSRRITHGNVFLRKTIIECAWGCKPHEGLLLQPFLLPSDTGPQEEQDESPRGRRTQAAHRSMACAARRDRLQGLRSR